MKTLKKIFKGLLAVVLVLVAVAYFLPRNVHVERSIDIKASPATIYNQINTLKNWPNWSPWHRMDPKMQITYQGPDSGVGASYVWIGNHRKVGSGHLGITASRMNALVDIDMVFGEQHAAKGSFKLEPEGEATKVTWSMDADNGWNPMARWFGLLMNTMVGPDFESGLKNLKEYTEKIPSTETTKTDMNDWKVQEVSVKPQHLVTLRGEKPTAIAEVGKYFGMWMGELIAYAQKSGQTMSGAPLAFFHTWDEVKKETDMEVAIPVAQPGKASGRIKAGELKAGQAAMVRFSGPYEGAGKAHAAIQEWVKTNKRQMTGSPWEVYLTNPNTEKDTSKWLTEVYYPIQ